jgi:hypothetical protein
MTRTAQTRRVPGATPSRPSPSGCRGDPWDKRSGCQFRRCDSLPLPESAYGLGTEVTGGYARDHPRPPRWNRAVGRPRLDDCCGLLRFQIQIPGGHWPNNKDCRTSG